MIYVSMTDKYMSGWGKAENKINKLVIECKDYNDAEIVMDNARNREEMKYINYHNKKPYYNNRTYLVNYKELDNPMYSSWHKKGYFK